VDVSAIRCHQPAIRCHLATAGGVVSPHLCFFAIQPEYHPCPSHYLESNQFHHCQLHADCCFNKSFKHLQRHDNHLIATIINRCRLGYTRDKGWSDSCFGWLSLRCSALIQPRGNFSSTHSRFKLGLTTLSEFHSPWHMLRILDTVLQGNIWRGH
jgi:hypothetical protein